MMFYSRIKVRSIKEVTEILRKSGHESVLKWISEINGKYVLNAPIQEISPLPTYKFALASTIAALGNMQHAEEILSKPEVFVEPGWGDEISTKLADSFSK